MRFSELKPEFTRLSDDHGRVWFNCPHCGMRQYLPFERGNGKDSPAIWGWNGEWDPEKVTFSPSIHLFDHWHGYVKNGEVTGEGVPA